MITIPKKMVALNSVFFYPNSLLTSFTDGSSRNNLEGIAKDWQEYVYQWLPISRTIFAPNQINTFANEPAVIKAAMFILLSQI